MTRILLAAIIAIGFSMTTLPASAGSPVLGNAKTVLISKDEAKNVTAKGGVTAYYLYLGLNYSSSAIYYAGLSQYYNYYNASGAGTYAYYAYYYSYYATDAYYNAYWNATS